MRKMRTDTVFKVVTEDPDEFDKIVKALETAFEVIATSKPVFNEEAKTWHRFFRLEKKVEA
jgi:hypothetical protein